MILTDVADRVGTITLNRPARRNALNGELIGALDDAVRQMAEDPDVSRWSSSPAPRPRAATVASARAVTSRTAAGGARAARRASRPTLCGRPVPPRPTTPPCCCTSCPSRPSPWSGGRPSEPAAAWPPPATCASPPTTPSSRRASRPTAWQATTAAPSSGPASAGRGWPGASTCSTRRSRRPEALALGMVHAVVAPDSSAPTPTASPTSCVQAPASVLALVKDNLNAAEDEVERRRWLFAHEAENQRAAGQALASAWPAEWGGADRPSER